MANRELPVFIWLPIILFATSAVAFISFNRVAVQDWVFFRGYTAPDMVTELITDAQFTEEGSRLFQRAAPETVSVAEIAEFCPNADNLGCLVTGPKIYMVDFRGESDRERAQMIVTGTHEMLHMAYFRLDDFERDRVDELVAEDVLRPGNEAVNAAIQRYSDPEERADEAHSILATEGETVSGELAQHYHQYLENRAAIVESYKVSR